MMKFIKGVLETLGFAFLVVVVFGLDPRAAMKELIWFWFIIGVVGIGLMFYIGHALTRAMNPKPKKKPDAEQ